MPISYNIYRIGFFAISGLLIAFGLSILVVGSLLAFSSSIFTSWASSPVEILNRYFILEGQTKIKTEDVGNFFLGYTKHLGVPVFTLGFVKILLAAYGVAVMIVAHKSAFTHNLLWVYFINTIFSTLLESGALFVLVYQSHQIQTFIQSEMKNTTDWYFGQSTTPSMETIAWDVIQINSHCCGELSCGDFESSKNWQRNFTTSANMTLALTCPATCCKLPPANATVFDISDCLRNPNYKNSAASYGCIWPAKKKVVFGISIMFTLWVISFILSMISMYLSMTISSQLVTSFLYKVDENTVEAVDAVKTQGVFSTNAAGVK